MTELTQKERHMLLEVAEEIGKMCQDNNEKKEDTEKIIAYCLFESVKQLTELKKK